MRIPNFLKLCPAWQLRLIVAFLGIAICLVIGHFWAEGGTVGIMTAACLTMSAPDLRNSPQDY